MRGRSVVFLLNVHQHGETWDDRANVNVVLAGREAFMRVAGQRGLQRLLWRKPSYNEETRSRHKRHSEGPPHPTKSANAWGMLEVCVRIKRQIDLHYWLCDRAALKASRSNSRDAKGQRVVSSYTILATSPADGRRHLGRNLRDVSWLTRADGTTVPPEWSRTCAVAFYARAQTVPQRTQSCHG